MLIARIRQHQIRSLGEWVPSKPRLSTPWDSVKPKIFEKIAEQVEKGPRLVACDEQGKPYTVRYEAVNAMLLNEFPKEHRKVEEQEKKVREQEAAIIEVKSTVAKQATTIEQQQKGNSGPYGND